MATSQYGQDRYIREKYLPTVDNGFFIELGALDGLRHSNTKFFEDLGWAGICIEAHPDLFRRLKRNRNCICVEALISSNHCQTSRFLAIDPRGPVGLSGLIDIYDPRHLHRILNECKGAGVVANEINMPTRTLADILHEHSIKHVDFFSLDVEGAELDVLKSIKWSDVDFGVLLIENNYGSHHVSDFVAMQGYRRVERRGLDDIFVKA
jgi:FkbM family methyltransferase